MDERKNDNGNMGIANVFIECMPLPWQCLKPNKRDYQNDQRIKRLEEEIDDQNTYICITGKENDVNRIFESVAGNNVCISLNDFRGMICRLPYDMAAYAKIGTRGGKDFL